MNVCDEVRRQLLSPGEPCVATIGTFDGVHEGHRSLLAAAAAAARAQDLECVAITFTPRPDVVWGRSELPDICPIDERVARLRRGGADRVVVLPFSRAFAGIAYDVFAGMLTDCLQMRQLYVGEDFALGAGRHGTPQALREFGIDVRTVPLVMAADGSEKISSSTIRRLIALDARAAAAPLMLVAA